MSMFSTRRKDPSAMPPLSLEKPLHEQAAEFANSVVELRDQKAAVEAKLTREIADHTQAQARIIALEEQLANLKQDYNFFHQRTLELEFKWQQIAVLFAEIIKTIPEPTANATQPAPKAEAKPTAGAETGRITSAKPHFEDVAVDAATVAEDAVRAALSGNIR